MKTSFLKLGGIRFTVDELEQLLLHAEQMEISSVSLISVLERVGPLLVMAVRRSSRR